MSSHTHTVASEEGAEFCRAEIGEPVTVELTDEQVTALVAAGWIEPVEKATTKATETETK